ARRPGGAHRERNHRGRLAPGHARPCARARRITGRPRPRAAAPPRIRFFFGECSMELDIVALSRLQFAMTALYHFIFVPLTLGLSILLAIMETVYVMTGRTIWRDMTKFWGVLFGINFALGVATGIVMEFQFGMNWSYYSHYVGDIF